LVLKGGKPRPVAVVRFLFGYQSQIEADIAPIGTGVDFFGKEISMLIRAIESPGRGC
jgi:hypothetical protein